MKSENKVPVHVHIDGIWPAIKNIDCDGVALQPGVTCHLLLNDQLDFFKRGPFIAGIWLVKTEVSASFTMNGLIEFSELPDGPIVVTANYVRESFGNETAAKLLEPRVRLIISTTKLIRQLSFRLDVNEVPRGFYTSDTLLPNFIKESPKNQKPVRKTRHRRAKA